MAATEKRTFTLPAEQSAFIDRLVMSGSYATASEVIREGLRALQERNTAIERWLHEEVAPAYDRWKVGPGTGVTAEEMADRMRKLHEARVKGGE